MTTNRARVLSELEKGPVTSRDVAEATGIPFPSVAASLSYFHQCGVAKRRELPKCGAGARERLYELSGGYQSNNKRNFR